MVGHGMMGVWHSDPLLKADCCRHTVVGRRPEPTAEFARRYGYLHWTTDLNEALANPEIDIVILANPSQIHAETTRLSLQHNKHTLVEIPLTMSLAEAEDMVELAESRRLTLGVVHPMRARPVFRDLKQRVESGKEKIRFYGGRFFIHRLENVGSTGYRRSWTDNLLWHHITHTLDLGLWLLDVPIRAVHSFMPPLDPNTGIPMEVFIGLETEQDQSLVCTGSYYGREKIFEAHVVTDRDSYRLEVLKNTLITSAGTQPITPEAENCARITLDFLDAVRDGREPMVSGRSILPAKRVLQAVQDRWDSVHGVQSIPGRPLPGQKGGE
jgi:2-hydroxy-4-carboxymuconate semialdehyde hemiacetal dehydrogenase